VPARATDIAWPLLAPGPDRPGEVTALPVRKRDPWLPSDGRRGGRAGERRQGEEDEQGGCEGTPLIVPIWHFRYVTGSI